MPARRVAEPPGQPGGARQRPGCQASASGAVYFDRPPNMACRRATRASLLLRRVNRFQRAGDLDDATVGELTLAQLRVLFRLRNSGPDDRAASWPAASA